MVKGMIQAIYSQKVQNKKECIYMERERAQAQMIKQMR